MTKLYDATIHDTTVLRLTVEAHSDDQALAEVSELIASDPRWRNDAELISGGTVFVHSIEEVIPPETKAYDVTFTEEATYALTVQARDPDHARKLAAQALAQGSTDFFEETANTRSPFTIEEAVS
jgi:hypothetical protein